MSAVDSTLEVALDPGIGERDFHKGFDKDEKKKWWKSGEQLKLGLQVNSLDKRISIYGEVIDFSVRRKTSIPLSNTNYATSRKSGIDISGNQEVIAENYTYTQRRILKSYIWGGLNLNLQA